MQIGCGRARNALGPLERRCLISLSDGGEDAVTVREFDLVTGKFVPNGFVLPKGKQDATWVDENTLLISREWHKGELTRSGYAFIVKRLKRGQPLSSAVEIYRGKPEDVGAFAGVLRDGQNRTLPVISRALDTFHSETYILTPKGIRKVAMPQKVSFEDMVDGRVIASLDEDWTPAGSSNKHFESGSLVSLDLAQLMADPAHPRAEPDLSSWPARGAPGCQLVQERPVRFNARQCPRPNLAVHARSQRDMAAKGDGAAGQFDLVRRKR